ncbi:MAG: helix-turn-helix domain-containing protein, partial [Clostridia bacterium]|nr:helix-turn-helix domain-containing protein [Clostridia bacterium]
MISENIKKLRSDKMLTQKELADKLHVTAQAVSRWENGEVEPSVGTISALAEIFGVTTDEIIGGPDKKPEKETVIKTEYVVKEQKPVLAVCAQCNKPIYEGKDIVRKQVHHGRSYETKIICKSCNDANVKRAHDQAVAHGELQRKRSFLWGGLATALIVAIALGIAFASSWDVVKIVAATVVAVLFFPFLSCLFLQNNFIGDLFEWITTWSIKMPGLIFTLDLDGIIWLLSVKLLLWILGAMLT